MVRANDRIALIGQVPLFAGLSKRQLKAIAGVVEVIDVPARTTLATEGEMGREMFVVVAGGARVVRGGRKVAELGPGEVFGELALIDGMPRTASVTTTAETMLFVIPGRAFKPLVLGDAKLATALLTTLAGRLREADRRLYG
ncbi:MAG: cyclic nucleotide-binding domain-containing protein [Acidimicrobiia bacterium]|jgi:CRP/FNR family transcriptional regulator, cyclic AMP receptor protein